MFDFELQMRFMRSAFDAWTGYATAGAATWDVWQRDAQKKFAGTPQPQLPLFDSNALNPFMWWANVLSNAQPMKSPAADFGAGFFQFAPQFSQPFAQPAASLFANPFANQFANPLAPMGQGNFGFPNFASPPWNNPWNNAWTEMMQSWFWAWPQSSWALFQNPMTAMLMSTGMPYSVAEPTARANAASMAAADAARQSFNNMYSSFQSGGGHAFVPLEMWGKFMQMAMMPLMTQMPTTNGPGRMF